MSQQFVQKVFKDPARMGLVLVFFDMLTEIEYMSWPKRMKLKTAAAMVNMSTKTIQNRIKEGKLSVYRDAYGTPLVEKEEVLGLWRSKMT